MPVVACTRCTVDDIPDLPAELIPDSIECEDLGHQIDNLLDWLDDHGYEPPDLHEGILATAAQVLTQPAPPAQRSVQTVHLHRVIELLDAEGIPPAQITIRKWPAGDGEHPAYTQVRAGVAGDYVTFTIEDNGTISVVNEEGTDVASDPR